MSKNKKREKRGSGGNYVNIRTLDFRKEFMTGTGLPKEVADKVFDFFTRDIDRNFARCMKAFLAQQGGAVIITTEIPAIKAIALQSQAAEGTAQAITRMRWATSNRVAEGDKDTAVNVLFDKASAGYIKLANDMDELTKKLQSEIKNMSVKKTADKKSEASSSENSNELKKTKDPEKVSDEVVPEKKSAKKAAEPVPVGDPLRV